MSHARFACGARGPETIVDGVRLAYDDTGPGSTGLPLVCLHAIGHGARDFDGLAAAIGDRRRVVALDWPGQGRSGDDHEPPSATRYAALLVAFLDRLGIERAVLLGNSIGGATAIRVAATRPDRVAALVLENPGGLDPRDALVARAITTMVRFFAAGARGARWFPAAYALYYRMILQRGAAATHRRRIVAAGPDVAAVLRDAWTGFGRPEEDLRDLAPRITCPTLFAWAARDQIIQLRRCLPAIGRFPNARLERLRAGHSAHLETPLELLSMLEPFLGTLRDGARGTGTPRSPLVSSGTSA
jgi:4,5:9,10-diseco-3-hydroxy-5,9,17-trioxoandrosta-1(10),2-diene-4-oate hydrolase